MPESNCVLVPKIFPNLNVVGHLAVPVGWRSCLPRLAIFYREVDMSDLPSQYAEEVETIIHIPDLPVLYRCAGPGQRERPTGAKAKRPFSYAPFKSMSQRCI